VEENGQAPRLVRFGAFEADVQSGELRKSGLKLKLSGQPFQVLAILLERPGEVVKREELQKRLWPDTFVDVDHNLNTAINKIREALGDSAENPRFVETLPRRGYRFVSPVEGVSVPTTHAKLSDSNTPGQQRSQILRFTALFATIVLLATAGMFFFKRMKAPPSPPQRSLTRLTFDDGLQVGATWSPDGRFLAYASDRSGKFDIWVQQVSGGDPLQITKRTGQNWQPDWSPDGKNIAYRSEEGDGSLYVAPALGGEGLERKIASFGYYPRWSPDSSQILFQTHFSAISAANRFYVARLDGSPPREILAEFLAEHKLYGASVVWHPDGKRVSVWVGDPKPSPIFWTIPLEGRGAIKSEISDSIEKQMADVTIEGEAGQHLGEFAFSWSPSGDAFYFERGYREAINIWKMTIDPQSLRAMSLERLTTGPGPDAGVAISRDGKRLAFTAKSQHIRNWLFAFDATKGTMSGSGQAITAPGRTALVPTLSRDGTRVAFCVIRAGGWDLWEKSLVDGREAPVITDEYDRRYAQWSHDGMRLAYARSKPPYAESQLMVWSRDSRSEEPLTAASATDRLIYDWSPDGKWILVAQGYSDEGDREIWRLPVAAAPHADAAAQKIVSDTSYSLWQPHYSPNGRWIIFEAVANSPQAAKSILYVVPSVGGGSWTRIAGGDHWDDKPRWSPDGKAIYFVSGRGGFFNVWGVRFDPERGRPLGEPFRVSAFERPSLMVPQWIPPIALSISQDKLVLTLAETSGGIWVLDNVDR
jgi:Tol biopolymer transport system component/DNA-binding winged helix-turn-helix (wHTH) protein